MVKRNSKRWEVQPDYEPPVTRLRARLDPSIVIPPIQPLPLPRRNRRARVAPSTAAPPLQIAEEQDTETPSENAGQMTETTTNNQNGELMKEMSEMRENAKENQMEETTKENQIAEKANESQLEDDEMEDDQMKDDQMKDDQMKDDQMKGGSEESVQKDPTDVNIVLHPVEGMISGSHESEGNEAWLAMQQVDEDPGDAWTAQDQKDLEKEIMEWKRKGKPEHERSFTWNLVVGKHNGSRMSSITLEQYSVDGVSRAANSQIQLTGETTEAVEMGTVARVGVQGSSPVCPLNDRDVERDVEHSPPEADEGQRTSSQSNCPPEADEGQRTSSQQDDRGSSLQEANNRLSASAANEQLRLNLEYMNRKQHVVEQINPLIDRRFVTNPLLQEASVPTEQFSVVSYNIMAELEKEIAGGAEVEFDMEVDTPPDLLPDSFATRLIQELHYLSADVFCFQSVPEWFWRKLDTNLSNWGYNGFKMTRRPGACSLSEAIYYKINRFYFIKNDSAFLDDVIKRQAATPDKVLLETISSSVTSREVVIGVDLRCRRTKKKLRVVSTRCAPEHRNRPDLQVAQVCGILKVMATSDDPGPTILCIHSDIKPGTELYSVITEGSIKDVTTYQALHRSDMDAVTGKPDHNTSLVAIYRRGFRHPMKTIKSAYAEVLGMDPPNVWKRESQTMACGSYLWFQEDQMQVVGVLDMVSERAVDTSGIPNEFFPSGSLSLKAVFQLRNEAPDSEVRQ